MKFILSRHIENDPMIFFMGIPTYRTFKAFGPFT